MWNDLTMQQRADVISMAVKAGMRDMKSIRSFYDETLGSRRFDDGGDTVTSAPKLSDIPNFNFDAPVIEKAIPEYEEIEPTREIPVEPVKQREPIIPGLSPQQPISDSRFSRSHPIFKDEYDYMNSDAFLTRVKKMTNDNEKARILATNMRNGLYYTKLPNEAFYDYTSNSQNSEYRVDESGPYWHNIYYGQVNDIPGFTKRGVIAHELGHSVYDGNKYGSLLDYHLLSPQYTSVLQRGRHKTLVDDETRGHDHMDTERIADIRGLQQQAKDAGIWDKTTGIDMTPEAFNKLKQAYPDNRSFDMWNDEDLRWLINTTAQNNTPTLDYSDRNYLLANGGHLYAGGGGIKKYVGDLEDITYDADNMKFYEKATGKELGDSAILDEVIVNGRNRANDYLTEANDNTSVYNIPHREYNQHLKDRAEQGAREAAIWREEHPNLSAWGEAAASIPLAVASVPLIAGGAEALAGTSAGQALTSGLNFMANAAKASPIAGLWPYADAGLTSAFAAHGASEIAEGNITPEALMEVAPLGQLAKPIYDTSKALEFGKKWSKISSKINKQIHARSRAERLLQLNANYMAFPEDFPAMQRLGSELETFTSQARDLKKLEGLLTKKIQQLLVSGKMDAPGEHLSKEIMGQVRNLNSKLFTNSLLEKVGKAGPEVLQDFLGKKGYTDIMGLYNPSTKSFEIPAINMAFDPTKAVTTGNIEIIDAATGQSKTFMLDPSALTGGANYKITYPSATPVGTITEARALHPQLPEEYVNAIQKNIDFVTQKALPNSKVFGSSANVVKGNLYHDAHDIDVIMTQKQAMAHPDFRKWSTVNGDTYQYNHPTAGSLDVNILREDAQGMATGARAHELYAQLYPREYSRIMKQAVKDRKFNIDEIPLDKTPEELLENYDPVTKSIADAFSSSKDKHIKRANYLLHYGNTADVEKGFKSYANYITGGEYKESNVPLEAFTDPNVNKKILEQLGLEGINKEQFINDPERMKLLYEYGYFHEGFLGRGVPITFKGKDVDIIDSMTHWNPNTEGGTARGVGLNTVLGGNSGVGDIYGTLVPEQLGMEIKATDPLEALSLKRGILGYRELQAEERAIIEQLADKYGINLDLRSFKSVLDSTSGKKGQKFKDFLADLEEAFSIPGIRSYSYSPSAGPYVSLTKDVDEDAIKQIMLRGMDRPVSSQHRGLVSSVPSDGAVSADFSKLERVDKKLKLDYVDKRHKLTAPYSSYDKYKKKRDHIEGDLWSAMQDVMDKEHQIGWLKDSYIRHAEHRIPTLERKLTKIKEKELKGLITIGGIGVSLPVAATIYKLISTHEKRAKEYEEEVKRRKKEKEQKK